MCIQSCNRNVMIKIEALAFVLLAVAAGNAFALSTDRNQPMDVTANYMRTDQNKNTNPDVSTTYLKGNVKITQGSIKTHSDEATIYQDNSDKASKPADAAKGDSGNSKIKRVLMVGKQAHMEQLHDDDCGLMTADADTIDYHTDTDLADLKGHVNVVQKDKGEFHGEHMVYNTKTGEMESGDSSPTSRVSMRFEPKSAAPQTTTSNNCGYPVGTAPAKKAPKKTEDKQ